MNLIRSLRRLPLWAQTCLGMLVLVLVLVLVRGLFGGSRSGPRATSASAPPAVETVPEPTVSAPPRPLPSGVEVAAASPVAPPAAASATSSMAPTELQAPISTLQPPEGVQEGHVVQVAQARDQYRQWATVSTTVVQVPDASFHAPADLQGHAQRVIWHAWFRLDMPTSVALLQVKGDAGMATAEIDGQPIGEVEHYANRAPDRQVSSIALSPGWHQLTVTQQGAAIGQIAVTDGRSAPVLVVPWAVTTEGVAEIRSEIQAPAPASTSVSPSGGVPSSAPDAPSEVTP